MHAHAIRAAATTDDSAPDAILLVSCYELGHEPLGLTVPAGVLARAGIAARLLDLAVAPIDEDAIARADLVAISSPMHTALRLGTRLAAVVRRVNPRAHVCFFGLYAGLNATHLIPRLADSCLGAEFEAPLLELARRIAEARRDGAANLRAVAPSSGARAGTRSPGRAFDLTPIRDGLAHRDRYVKLAHADALQEVGYVATTRGCKHLCRHCPLPPAYAGAFYALPLARVLDDIAAVVWRGARHVTFADADFLNGPTHALRVAREMARRFPGLTFDYTAKVEHLLRHHAVVRELQELGSLFVVSAVESFNDAVLTALRKGHSRDQALDVVRRLRAHGPALRPTFVPFTPWETRVSYAELLDIVDGEGLVDHIDPVQYSIRLLVPEGSLLLGSEEMRPHLGAFDGETFSYSWSHPDASMDALQRTVARIAADAVAADVPHPNVFARIRDGVAPGRAPQAIAHRVGRVPRLTEDWFC
jgi:radical SAM superfamily enzyme YgiQ (UPF0313 family)